MSSNAENIGLKSYMYFFVLVRKMKICITMLEKFLLQNVRKFFSPGLATTE